MGVRVSFIESSSEDNKIMSRLRLELLDRLLKDKRKRGH
jgi:hypothetical protein